MMYIFDMALLFSILWLRMYLSDYCFILPIDCSHFIHDYQHLILTLFFLFLHLCIFFIFIFIYFSLLFDFFILIFISLFLLFFFPLYFFLSQEMFDLLEPPRIFISSNIKRVRNDSAISSVISLDRYDNNNHLNFDTDRLTLSYPDF